MKIRRILLSLLFLVIYILTTCGASLLSLTCPCPSVKAGAEHICTDGCAHEDFAYTDLRQWDASSCACSHHILADKATLYLDSAVDRDRGHQSVQTLHLCSAALVIAFIQAEAADEEPTAPQTTPLTDRAVTPRPQRGPPAWV